MSRYGNYKSERNFAPKELSKEEIEKLKAEKTEDKIVKK